MESKIKELYEKESGRKCPNNQIGFMDWHTDYIKWIEQKLLQSLSLPPDKEVVSDELLEALITLSELVKNAGHDLWLEHSGSNNAIKKHKESRLSNVKEGEVMSLFNSDKFIQNVCLSYRHDFGLMSEKDKQLILFECKEWMRAITNNSPKSPSTETDKSEAVEFGDDFEGERPEKYLINSIFSNVKQIDAIDFTEWIYNNDIEKAANNRWYMVKKREFKTTQELYSIYKQSKTK